VTVRLAVCARTDIGRRSSNQDAFLVADLTADTLVESATVSRLQVGERGVLLAVSDGMGGHKAGGAASAVVIESLRRWMSGAPGDARSEIRLARAVEGSSREAWDAAQKPGCEGMGATVTALFLDGGTAYIAEVGDSRAYILRGGVLVQVTHDQSYVQLLVDRGALKAEDAAQAPHRNVILQAMGQATEVQVALGKLELRQRDCLLLCSDGLTNELTADEIARTILDAPTLDEACDRLILLAKRRGGRDNITAILGGVSGDLPPLVAGADLLETLQVLREFQAPMSMR
jgi:serine/threonine protein phosphatase PrpC